MDSAQALLADAMPSAMMATQANTIKNANGTTPAVYSCLAMQVHVTSFVTFSSLLVIFNVILRHFTTFYDVLQRFTMLLVTFYDVLRRFTTFYDVLRRFTTFYDILRRFTMLLRCFFDECCGIFSLFVMVHLVILLVPFFMMHLIKHHVTLLMTLLELFLLTREY